MSNSILLWQWWQESHKRITNRERKLRKLDEQRHLHRATRRFNAKGGEK